MYNVIQYDNKKTGEWSDKGYMVTKKPLEYFLAEFNPQLVGTIQDYTEAQAIELTGQLNKFNDGGLFDMLRISIVLNKIPSYTESTVVLNEEEAETWRNSL